MIIARLILRPFGVTDVQILSQKDSCRFLLGDDKSAFFVAEAAAVQDK